MNTKAEVKTGPVTLTRKDQHRALIKWEAWWNSLSPTDRATELAATAGQHGTYEFADASLPRDTSGTGGTDIDTG